ncbi:hypothetical protein H6P81_003548 [Aristolochia fimbriata]|uniref:Myb-like domain-containing protein n=1 Tax=Aristolochia fimbriata TaxID=158543 RepID=A0AAV7FFW3_ARIFI|nr:hypothetical protein H6P81_003548 [Aristolochia fimbriata]
MEMGSEHQQYGLPDLRQLLAGRTHFPAALPGVVAAAGDQYNTANFHHGAVAAARNHLIMGASGCSDALSHGGAPHLHHHHHHHQFHQRLMMAGDFRSESSTSHSAAAAFDEAGLWVDGGNGRWPRQETLTLLEIRSRLDPRFKDANQKGPLWDEVARLMAEEHGYHRSGKKCREKFENLYKYYKKTKEGKAGRQDGKHYRFFRQLEALYGETSTSSHQTLETNHINALMSNNNHQHALVPTNPGATQLEGFPAAAQKHLSESLSLSMNSSEFDSSSSEDAEIKNCTENDSSFVSNKKDIPKNLKRGRRKSWKSKLRDFVDLQMKKFMEIQEGWLEKMLTTLEKKEQERMSREEEWRKEEAERFEREHKLWAKERAWVQSRDIALMEALQKICGKEEVVINEIQLPKYSSSSPDDHDQEEEDNICDDSNYEEEALSLMRVRSSMESRFQQGGCSSKNALWEEISGKMRCLGYEGQSAKRCKEKWEKMMMMMMKCKHPVSKNNNNIKECCNYKKSRKEKNYSKSGTTCTPIYLQQLESLYIPGRGDHHESDERDGPSPPCNSLTGGAPLLGNDDHCFNFLMGDQAGDNSWENYVMKINKGE